jgi:hypothetical protein
MSCFRKFKKSRAASKHPVSVANPTPDVMTDPPSSGVSPVLDPNPEGVFCSVDLTIDGADLATIGTTNRRCSPMPLPERESGTQGTRNTITTTSNTRDGGDAVGECSVHCKWDWN